MLLSTTSGAGHFRPLLPLARALTRAGDELACAAPAEAAGMVEREGLRHLPFDGVPPDHPDRIAAFTRAPELPPHEGRHLVGSVVFGRLNTTFGLPGARAAVAGFAPDLVLHETAENACRLAAEAEGVPVVAVHPTLAIAAFSTAIADGIAELRVSLGLTPDPGSSALLGGHGISWFPPSFDVPEAPPHLRRYRDGDLPEVTPVAERSLVYVTLGSEAPGLPFFVPVLQQMVAGAVQAGLHVVVATGREIEAAALAGIDGDIRVEPWVDQAQVLDKARVVVCHAGAGTTLGALAAQVPVVAVPLFADQPDNADRIEATGCGRRVTPTAAEVAAAVQELARDLPEGSVRVARDLAGLPGADQAVPWLRSLTR